MTIKQLGGIFGRNPTFEDVTIEGTLTFDGDIDINSDLRVDGDLDVNGTVTADRASSDGTCIDIQKDGVSLGTLGASVGDLFIQGKLSGHSGLRFDSSAIIPFRDNSISDNTTNLGLSNVRFKDIYATNGTIQTSDRNEKQDIEELSDAERRVAVAVKGLLRKFRWISAVEEKGEEARIHFGVIAQDLEEAFTAEGLDADRYGMFINTTWTDEETGEEHSRMGVRYSELLAFIISAI